MTRSLKGAAERCCCPDGPARRWPPSTRICARYDRISTIAMASSGVSPKRSHPLAAGLLGVELAVVHVDLVAGDLLSAKGEDVGGREFKHLPVVTGVAHGELLDELVRHAPLVEYLVPDAG